ncbi:DUF732 domain-containing protein [Candidatus Mycobacterium methanotrophicum]|uniref:DUF732 domain-containing protein n=1 Tax=Candidatus Mycobacterium methanotrophicum TaxID=2943498 RepID=A0ABY4QGI5_9MYCO|nr:DUF732 domain-containing protein [Candidatus Mycobacterium methanotrophicum]UQX09602.1 DUF732 domain-containing protein [Candidatus Mycobacterium methanotrophicum]
MNVNRPVLAATAAATVLLLSTGTARADQDSYLAQIRADGVTVEGQDIADTVSTGYMICGWKAEGTSEQDAVSRILSMDPSNNPQRIQLLVHGAYSQLCP